MKKLKKLSAILVAMLVLFSAITTTAFAADVSQDGLEVSLITNKEAYEQGEQIAATLTVKNTNDFAVKNVTLESLIPDGYVLADGTSATKELNSLEPGETAELAVTFIAKGETPTDPTNPTDPTDPTEPTDPTDPVEPTEPDEPIDEDFTDNGLWKIVFPIMGVTGFVAIIIALANFKKILALILAAIIGGSFITGGIFKAGASDKIRNISIETTVDVADEPKKIAGNVSYSYEEPDTEDDKIVTKSEWVSKLADALNWSEDIESMQNDDETFTDIKGKECERTIKFASIKGLFDEKTGNFYPDEPATREFVAVTSVRAMMFSNTQSIESDDKHLIKHPEEVYTAVNLELFALNNNNFNPQKELTVKESEKVVAKILEIEKTTQDTKEHSEVIYKDSYVELSDSVKYTQENDVFHIEITEETKKLQKGNIVYLNDEYYKIADVKDSDGKYIVKTEEPSMQEVFELINIGNSINLSADDFVPAEGVEMIKTQSRTKSQKGGSIDIGTMSFKVDREIEDNVKFIGEISLKNPKLDYNIDIDFMHFLPFVPFVPYCNDVHMILMFDVEAKIGIEDTRKDKAPLKGGYITLGFFPIAGVKDAGAYIEVSIAYNIEGKAEVVFSTDCETGFQVYKNLPRPISSIGLPLYDVTKLEASAKSGPKFSGLLELTRKWKLIDFSFFCGGAIKGSLNIRDTGLHCLDGSTYLFVDFEAMQESVINNWIDVKYSCDILNEKNSFLKERLHFENMKYVPECTYSNLGKVGDIIEFGSYPQSRVNDPIILKQLQQDMGEWHYYNYYSGNGNFGSMYQDNYMKYKDVVLNNEKYRCVMIEEYRPFWSGSQKTANNSYQDDNGYSLNEVYYFKFEPIKWRVLDNKSGLVMSESLIDAQPFNNMAFQHNSEYYTDYFVYETFCCNYKYSDIREWLNDDFYNTAFSNDDKKYIKTTELENKNDKHPQYGEAETYDNVFLLSYYDTINEAYGFNSNSNNYDVRRIAKGTDYARCQGLYEQNESSLWRLRTSGTISGNTCCGYFDGRTGYVNETYNTSDGIRPAICLKSINQ